MTDWSAGYVSDIDYTYGYYPELCPNRSVLPLLNVGLACPQFETACELGFGQGVSINIHGATSNTKWYGNDFNPAQAGFAQELAKVVGGGVHAYDDSFEDFGKREELPDFDFIGMHGIWSWISDDNRKAIVDFIDKKLKVGGVLYMSYNTLPGWTGFAPVRHIMTEHVNSMSPSGQNIVKRIDSAIVFMDKLMASEPLFDKIFPSAKERIETMKGQNRQYLAHEYFNKDWHPMHFSTVAEWLEPAKLQYACSAHYPDHLDALNLSQTQQSLLSTIDDVSLRESVRDFMTNQGFRRDYWVKGARKLSPAEQAAKIFELRFVPAFPLENIPMKVKGMLGDAELSPDIYHPIFKCFSNLKPKSIAELQSELPGDKINFTQLIQAMMVLSSAGYLRQVQPDSEISSCKKKAAALNKYLLDQAHYHGDFKFLASPVVGSCVAVNRYNQLFLRAIENKLRTPEEIAKHVWQLLSGMGVKIIKENKTLESEAESLTELATLAKEFLEIQYPVLKAIQVA